MSVQQSKEYMVKVAAANNVREVYEIPGNAPAREVDAASFNYEKKVTYIGAYANGTFTSPIRLFDPCTFVEVETGHEEEPGTKTVVFIKHR